MLQIMPYAIAVLLTFLVTLSAFAAITMQVNQSYYHLKQFEDLSFQVVSTAGNDTLWGSKFYVPVACFLLFNIGDYVGRLHYIES